MRSAIFLLSLALSVAVSANSFRQVVITEPGGPEVLRVVEVSPVPEPGPGEVRIRVIAASASFTDVMVRKGIYGGIAADLPYPPGYDLAGVIDKVGQGVSGFTPGQRVADMTIWGAYTEYAIRPAENLVPVPDGLPAEEAAVLVLAYVTAYQMLFRVADVQPGQSILIHGASGAVGTALAQLGREVGLQMYGTASTAKQDYLRDLGVIPIDYRTEDFVERVKAATGGEGVYAVFDAIGVDNFARSYSVLRKEGLLVEYGLYLKTRDENSIFGLVGEFLSWKLQQLRWEWFPEQDRRFTFYSIADMRTEQPQWFKEDLASLFQLALDGKITPRIWKRLPLDEAAQAHRLIEAGDVRGKIVLSVSADPGLDKP
jgi:NADPH:quinone reductase-like Zn-dependent oxidoreductase